MIGALATGPDGALEGTKPTIHMKSKAQNTRAEQPEGEAAQEVRGGFEKFMREAVRQAAWRLMVGGSHGVVRGEAPACAWQQASACGHGDRGAPLRDKA